MNHYCMYAGGWKDDAIDVVKELWEKYGADYVVHIDVSALLVSDKVATEQPDGGLQVLLHTKFGDIKPV